MAAGAVVAERTESGRTQWYLPVLTAGMALLVVTAVVGVFVRGNSHDQSWYLLLGERLLAGEKLYGPTMVETNPPLIIWFSAITVLFGKLLHVEAYTALRLVVMAMIAGSSWWCVRLLRRGEGLVGLPVGWFAMLFGCGVALLQLSLKAAIFAQREHLFDILVMPYVVGVLTGAVKRCGVAERIALGVAAGLGVCFKPQEVFVVVALEAWLLIWQLDWRRLISAEVLAAAATGVVFVAVVGLYSPLYQKEMLPLILDTYWAYGSVHAVTLLRLLKWQTVLGLGLAATALALRRWLPGATAVLGIVACSFGAALAYAVQHTDWDYHLMPAQYFLETALVWSVLAAVLKLVENKAGERGRRWSAAAATMVMLLGLAVSLRGNTRRAGRPMDSVGMEVELLQGLPEGTPVYVLSSRLGYLTNVYSHHLQWASRFPCQWMMPGLTAFDQAEAGDQGLLSRMAMEHLSPDRAHELETMEWTGTAEDLERWKPVLVLVEPCTLLHPCQAMEGRTVDVAAWFNRSPEFQKAWAAYERRPDFGEWQVYVRRGASVPALR